MIPSLSDALAAVQDKTGPVVTCHPNSIYKQVNTICANNSLPLIGTRGLRHSFASLAYHLGMPEQDAMRMGGWDDRETMHRIYVHLPDADAAQRVTPLKDFFKCSFTNDFTNKIPVFSTCLRLFSL